MGTDKTSQRDTLPTVDLALPSVQLALTRVLPIPSNQTFPTARGYMRAAPGVGGKPEPLQGTSAAVVNLSWLLGASADNEEVLLFRKYAF